MVLKQKGREHGAVSTGVRGDWCPMGTLLVELGRERGEGFPVQTHGQGFGVPGAVSSRLGYLMRVTGYPGAETLPTGTDEAGIWLHLGWGGPWSLWLLCSPL